MAQRSINHYILGWHSAIILQGVFPSDKIFFADLFIHISDMAIDGNKTDCSEGFVSFFDGNIIMSIIFLIVRQC